MGRFDFVSPGGMAGDAVSRYFADLEERRLRQSAEQRAVGHEQRLAQQHAAAIEMQREQLKSIDAQRQATIEKAKQDADAAAQKQFAGQYRPGDKVSADEAKKFPGMVAVTGPTQGKHLGDDEQGIPQYEVNPEQATFRGDAAQREKDEIEKRRRELESDPSLPEAARAAIRAGVNPSAAMFEEKLDTRSLQIRADEALAKGDRATYDRILQTIKETGRADDPPQRGFAPFIITSPGSAPMFIDRNSSTPTATPIENAPVIKTAEQANREAALGRVDVVLDSVSELTDRINVNEGVWAKAVGAAEKQAAKINLDDDVAEYEALVKSFTPLWARAIGHVGVLTEQDVLSAREALPKPGDSRSLRDRKLARIKKIMAGKPEAGAATAPASPPSQTETPEQRRERLKRGGYLPAGR